MRAPTPLTDAFLQNLKNQLKTLKIRQTHLAKAIGVRPQNLNRWFKGGLRKPTGEFILRMQAWMKTKISMFL